MKSQKSNSILLFVSILILVTSSCSPSVAEATATSTPKATATITLTSTITPSPSPTPRPTKTPNLAATQRSEELNAEVQEYYDKGFLSTTNGSFLELDDFSIEWAQLGWYH